MLRIAIVGGGAIGREHARRVAANPRCLVAGVVDPSPAAREWAASAGFPCLDAAPQGIDGAVIATPNDLHVPQACAYLRAGVPVLVEKPVADRVEAGAELVRVSKETGVPVLVGHHRRHSPAVQAARACIASGKLGRLVAVNLTTLFRKPPEYFDVPWRRGPAGGPILINLIHDIDTLRFLVGEVVAVEAIASNGVRGFEVEDTAAVLLQFANGAVGTLLVSDACVSPRSWEQTSGENPMYPRDAGQDHLFLAGTAGSLSVPTMQVWRQEGAGSWVAPFLREQVAYEPGDPLVRQMDHFCNVIERRADPLVSAADALETLRVTMEVRYKRTPRQTAPLQTMR